MKYTTDAKIVGYVVKMTGLYHMDDTRPAYYRRRGDCFDFTGCLENATICESADDPILVRAMDAKDIHLDQYGASKIDIVPVYQTLYTD